MSKKDGKTTTKRPQRQDLSREESLKRVLAFDERKELFIAAVNAEQRFKKLARTWKAETELTSKVSKRVLHPAYQKIIGMGEPAVPLILKDLAEHGPDDWFWALTAITDHNPITEAIAGNMSAMTEAWLAWGRRNGYLDDCRERQSEPSPI